MNPNYRDWLAGELATSEPWRGHVDCRRAQARAPRRTASGYSVASYGDPGQIAAALDGWRGVPRSQRPFAWSEDRVAGSSRDPAPNEPVEHLRRYAAGLRQDEKSWVGASSAAELHQLYRSPTGYLPSLPSSLALYPAPTGGQASLAAAKISGASWGATAARRQAFYRASPRHKEREHFTALLRPRLPEA